MRMRAMRAIPARRRLPTEGGPRTDGRPHPGSRSCITGRPGAGSRRGPHPGPGPRGDRGQVAVEFLGMAPVILVTLVLLWQCVLLGYTYTLAGNAADEAVRAAATAEGGQGACEQAGREDLPGAWQDGATISCGGRGSGYVTARVELKVPVLLPGLIGFPVPVKAHAGAVEEGKAN